MTTPYERAGLRFEYPENWLLDEEQHASGFSVTLEAPTGGFWSLRVENGSVSPQEFLTTALEALRADYDELEAEEVIALIEDRKLLGLDVNFFYLDLTSTAKLRALSTPRETLLVLMQAEDREFEDLEPVFRGLLVSLLRSL